jgi:hypothetical protein
MLSTCCSALVAQHLLLSTCCSALVALHNCWTIVTIATLVACVSLLSLVTCCWTLNEHYTSLLCLLALHLSLLLVACADCWPQLLLIVLEPYKSNLRRNSNKPWTKLHSHLPPHIHASSNGRLRDSKVLKSLMRLQCNWRPNADILESYRV